jgi:hypothetical protein
LVHKKGRRHFSAVKTDENVAAGELRVALSDVEMGRTIELEFFI